MSNLAVVPAKSRKIAKKVPPSNQKLLWRQMTLKINKVSSIETIEPPSNNESLTKAEIQSPLFAPKSKGEPSLEYFQSYKSFTLGSFNSITYNNGRIYDLLYIKKQGPVTQKQLKCRCQRSECSARYCDCFANGQICGESCECLNCRNTVSLGLRVQVASAKFCACSRSQCQQKYCECLQRGDSCSSKCRCQSCKNSTGSAPFSQF